MQPLTKTSPSIVSKVCRTLEKNVKIPTARVPTRPTDHGSQLQTANARVRESNGASAVLHSVRLGILTNTTDGERAETGSEDGST